MICHIVTFSFNDSADDAAVEQIRSALSAYADRQPALRSYRHGPDLGIRGTADYGVVAEVDDEAGLAAYLDDPEHVRIVKELVEPLLDSRQAVQIEV
ncbi:Dabb family protein [Calidifontibacter sp. DB0510]|uniref:Dabb family protein n=1 Tax=Metallococcus carri TaxID=1656884 RepID=A0A967B4T6_9MICO|nr:Dabb family protein [Metallococcus carri]NHN54641.1 Dabb family protein [Metallococcus carri]NOP36520.1 Dabb family protein [Calidifontibacter sp. DB2511S]